MSDLIIELRSCGYMAMPEGRINYTIASEAADRIEALEARVARLEAALKEAAEVLDHYSPLTGRSVETGNSRAARAALKGN